MATPTTQQVHIDNALTNISIAYRNASYIADQIFPPVPVNNISNKYFVFARADWYRDEAAVRAPGTKAQEVDYNISTSAYTCIEYAVAKKVPDEVVMNADSPLRPLIEATEFVTDKLWLRKEKAVADLVFGSGTWAASATPGSPAVLTQQAIAALFELENILVGTAVIDSAAEGATASRAYVWGNHLAVLYVTRTPSLLTPSAGYIFTFKTRQVNRFRLDEEHSDKVEALESWDEVATAPDAGYLVKSAA